MHYETKRPKTGPWIIPPNEARAYIGTENGTVAVKNLFPPEKLRQDQLDVKTNWRNFKASWT